MLIIYGDVYFVLSRKGCHGTFIICARRAQGCAAPSAAAPARAMATNTEGYRAEDLPRAPRGHRGEGGKGGGGGWEEGGKGGEGWELSASKNWHCGRAGRTQCTTAPCLSLQRQATCMMQVRTRCICCTCCAHCTCSVDPCSRRVASTTTK